nr:hypothetical protein [Leptospira perolatii]
MFARLRPLRTPTFLTLLFAVFLTYLLLRWTLLVRNPEANLGLAWIQFLAGCLPNFYHRKTGRIWTVALVLLAPGLLSSVETGFLWVNSLLAGATFGVFLRQYVSTFYGHSTNDEDPVLRYFYINRPYKNSLSFTENPKTGLLVLLLACILERILHYFGTSSFTHLMLPDTEYSSGVSSKYAFALTLDGIGIWLSSVVYFMAEEISSHDTDPPVKHWRQGLALGFAGNLILGCLQALSGDTNFPFTPGNAETFGVTGFFPDANSFNLGMPILASVLFYYIHSRSWRLYSRVFLSAVILIPLFIAGRYSGTVYWILLILQVGMVVGLAYRRMVRNRILKYAFFPIVAACTLLVLIGVGWLGKWEWTPTAWQVLHEDFVNAWTKGKGFSKLLEFYWKDGWVQTLSAWNWFKEAPVFGQGFGGFALHWIELGPRGAFPQLGWQDFQLSSWILMMEEGGVFFFLLFGAWIGLEAFQRGHAWTLLLLLFPVTFYSPWTGGAGILGFLVFWILGSSQPSTKELPKWWIVPVFNLVCLLFGLILGVKTLISLSSKAQGAEFRYEERKTFQLSAKEKYVSKYGSKFHAFRSGVSWVIGDKGSLNFRVALSDDPKPGKPVYIRWKFWDQAGVELQARSIPLNGSTGQVSLSVPSGAKFLSAEIMRISLLEAGPNEFFVSTDDFDGLNRIR